MPEDIVSVLKLMLKTLLPVIDESNSEKTQTSSVITVKKDGRKFKVTCIVEPEANKK